MDSDRNSMVNLEAYPELKLLCWDIVGGSISRRHAFSLYINRWGHVDESRLSDAEKTFIEGITHEYGRGLFFPHSHGRSTADPLFAQVAISEREIEVKHLTQFCRSVSDHSYPGMRDGVLYFWRADYEKFLLELQTHKNG